MSKENDFLDELDDLESQNEPTSSLDELAQEHGASDFDDELDDALDDEFDSDLEDELADDLSGDAGDELPDDDGEIEFDEADEPAVNRGQDQANPKNKNALILVASGVGGILLVAAAVMGNISSGSQPPAALANTARIDSADSAPATDPIATVAADLLQSDFEVVPAPEAPAQSVAQLNESELTDAGGNVGALAPSKSADPDTGSTQERAVSALDVNQLKSDLLAELQRSTSLQSKDVAHIQALSNQVRKLTQDLERIKASKDDARPAAIQNMKAPLLSAGSNRLDLNERSVLLSGRHRVPFTHVISTASEGKMAIVRAKHSDGDRISVLFAGESVNLRNIGTRNVTEVADSGHIVLIGSGWYIDDILIEPELSREPVPSSSAQPGAPGAGLPDLARQELVRPEEPSEITITKSAQPVSIMMTQVPERTKVFDKEVLPSKTLQRASGYIVNGIFDDKYLIQTPSGEWLAVKAGDTIKGLGVVEGLDNSNNVVVGEYVIMLSAK